MSAEHPNDEILAAYTADELTAVERAAFEEHLALCPACAHALAQTRAIRTLLNALAPTSASDPAPSLAGEVIAHLRRSSETDRPAFGTESVPDDHPLVPPGSTIRPVSPAAAVLGTVPESDPPPTPSCPVVYRGGAGNAFRRNQTMDQRAHDISDDSPHPFADSLRARPRLPARGNRGRSFMAVAAVLVLALLSTILFDVLGQRPSRPGPTVSHIATATPIPTTAPVRIPGIVIDPRTGLPRHSGFTQLQMLGPSDLWGLGYVWLIEQTKTQQGLSYSFFGHFDGQKWSIWPIPQANIALNSFSMDSSTDGWAVGAANLSDPRTGLLVHYSGGQVSQMHVPGAGNLFRVQMLSATEGWAVGTAPASETPSPDALPPVTLRYSSGAWGIVPNTLYPEGAIDLSMDSPAHGWVLDAYDHLGYFADGQWQQWHQAFTGDRLFSVSSLSPDDAWAVGSTGLSPSGLPGSIVLHFDGHSWAPVAIPALQSSPGSGLYQVTMLSPTDGWMLGALLSSPPMSDVLVQKAVVLHYDGTQWRSVPPPANLVFFWISLSASTHDWGIGCAPPNSTAFYLCRYHSDAWSIFAPLG